MQYIVDFYLITKAFRVNGLEMLIPLGHSLLSKKNMLIFCVL